MKFRTILIPAALIFLLAGCGGAPTPGTDPSASPILDPPASSPTPEPSPSVAAVSLPADCASLVRTSVIQAEFGPSFVPIVLPSPGSLEAQSFQDRGGLTCLWGIPQSGAAMTVFAASRATATDAEQENAWRAAGYSECPPFLDACFFDVIDSEMGEYSTVHVLVAGFELEISGATEGIDPLLIIAREASNNMGYL